MLCDKCAKHEAAVLITRNINGVVTELNLCPECAAAATGEGSFNDALNHLMNSLMGLSSQPPSGQAAAQNAFEPGDLSCPTCGLTYERFRAGGRLGCADCYGAFRKPLAALFKNVHGSTTHVGKAPKRGQANLIKSREIVELQKSLKECVAREEYEKAAVLRDRIKELAEK